LNHAIQRLDHSTTLLLRHTKPGNGPQGQCHCPGIPLLLLLLLQLLLPRPLLLLLRLLLPRPLLLLLLLLLFRPRCVLLAAFEAPQSLQGHVDRVYSGTQRRLLRRLLLWVLLIGYLTAACC
jgi:hypothetical protein